MSPKPSSLEPLNREVLKDGVAWRVAIGRSSRGFPFYRYRVLKSAVWDCPECKEHKYRLNLRRRMGNFRMYRFRCSACKHQAVHDDTAVKILLANLGAKPERSMGDRLSKVSDAMDNLHDKIG